MSKHNSVHLFRVPFQTIINDTITNTFAINIINTVYVILQTIKLYIFSPENRKYSMTKAIIIPLVRQRNIPADIIID